MIQKSIPLLHNTTPPHSAAAKKLLREILNSNIEPLHPNEIKKLFRHQKTRKRVFLSPKQDSDLIQFFDTAPRSLQYAVFLAFNKKLQEERL